MVGNSIQLPASVPPPLLPRYRFPGENKADWRWIDGMARHTSLACSDGSAEELAQMRCVHFVDGCDFGMNFCSLPGFLERPNRFKGQDDTDLVKPDGKLQFHNLGAICRVDKSVDKVRRQSKPGLELPASFALRFEDLFRQLAPHDGIVRHDLPRHRHLALDFPADCHLVDYHLGKVGDGGFLSVTPWRVSTMRALQSPFARVIRGSAVTERPSRPFQLRQAFLLSKVSQGRKPTRLSLPLCAVVASTRVCVALAAETRPAASGAFPLAGFVAWAPFFIVAALLLCWLWRDQHDETDPSDGDSRRRSSNSTGAIPHEDERPERSE